MSGGAEQGADTAEQSAAALAKLRDHFDEQIYQQLAELTAGPLVGGGQFTVIAAQQRGAATMSSALSWFDRPDDGRYLMARGDTTRVAAAGFGSLVGELAQQLNHAARY